MAAQGTAVVDFASGGSIDATVAVTQGGVWALAEAWIWPVASSNNTADNHVAENFTVLASGIVANTSFNIYARCAAGRAFGQYNVAWAVA